jgi:hypothetical protein
MRRASHRGVGVIDPLDVIGCSCVVHEWELAAAEWRARHRSMAALAGVLLCVIAVLAGMVVYGVGLLRGWW